MEVTNETLAPYIDGQLEIQYCANGWRERGEVFSLGVQGDILSVTFAWVARGSLGQGKERDQETLTMLSKDRQERTFALARDGARIISEERLALQTKDNKDFLVLSRAGHNRDIDPEIVRRQDIERRMTPEQRQAARLKRLLEE